MTQHQKSAVAALIGTILVIVIYGAIVFPLYAQGRFDGPDGASAIGVAILCLIAGGIVVNIVVNILFSILHAIATNEPRPSFVIDERDKAIELRGVRLFFIVVGVGFVLSMVALALDQPLFLVFNLMVFGFSFGDVASNVLKLVIHRRGF